MRSRSSYLLKFAILFTFVMLLIAVMQLSSVRVDQNLNAPEQLAGVIRPVYKPLSSVNLTDQDGNQFDVDRFSGKWSFVFFGYTSCPDVCPATLSILNTVVQKIRTQQPDSMDDVRVVFVSVDPQRDTQKKLSNYMSYFNSGFTGVTGDTTEIDKLAKQFSAGYSMEPETEPGEYLVNHTSAVFLVDPEARLVATFSQPHSADTITAQFKKIQRYITR